jgi:hypothetical protein
MDIKIRGGKHIVKMTKTERSHIDEVMNLAYILSRTLSDEAAKTAAIACDAINKLQVLLDEYEAEP